MTKRKGGLGRGLETLLGAPSTDEAHASGPPHVLALAVLKPGKYQPRTRMDEGALADLAASIKVQGVMQPILVRSIGGGRYEIIAGERRVRAAAIAGLTEVPVLVRDVADESAAAMSLIENIQREDLNPLEEAQGVHRLVNEFHLTHEDAARAIGRSRSATSNLLRLLNLAKPVQTMLMSGDLDMGHARALLAVDAGNQITIANQIVGRRLSVRETERLVARSGDGHGRPRGKRGSTDHSGGDVGQLETELSDLLATKVAIRMLAKGRGRLIVDFADLEQLDGVLERIRGRAG